MFKRSLASLAVVAVASGAVVAPANAMTVTVNTDMTCTITPTDEETRLINLEQRTNLDKKDAANIKESIVKGQLSTLRTKIENAKKELDNLAPGTAAWEKLTSDLKEYKEKFTAYKNFSDALDACIAGRNYDSNNPERPNTPPDGPKRPGDSNKPDGSERPDDKRALPSTNGAVIGAIVAVLGILAAALPFIKSILPAQLRALLP
ncbi:hypothetical protein I4J35_12875 [Corynebacterium belfantii]|uniref:hypothetical protein n=1 Tax=Corynebacterium belfantii TaxID=2014537 RepID=UPI0018D32F27|nr:hypothetical protein [Corynebacterium belfantii]MBG9329624.1 hypothetical protein [Corynebacterium belfantii]